MEARRYKVIDRSKRETPRAGAPRGGPAEADIHIDIPGPERYDLPRSQVETGRPRLYILPRIFIIGNYNRQYLVGLWTSAFLA